ncbi:MAG: hypothetical protein AAF219_07075 [Myxococcota bacterium]
MAHWEFELVLSGFTVDFEQATDALFEAGCDDCTITQVGTTPILAFGRDAPTFRKAIESALSDVKHANVVERVVRVLPDDLVTASDIHRRSGITKEMVRRYASGERTRGDFPAPVAMLEKQKLWSWFEVSSWFVQGAGQHRVSVDDVETARVLANVNDVLARTRGTRRNDEIAELARSLAL